MLASVRSRVMKHAQKITLQPARYPRLSKLLYPSIRRLARWRGVGEIFLTRADGIRQETRSDLTAARFLRFLMQLERPTGAGSLFYDFAAMLATEHEREAARKLIEGRLQSSLNSKARHLLETNLLRLQGVVPESEVATDLAARMVDDSITRFRSQRHKSRDKHFNKADALKALVDLKARFDAADKRFFLDRGTLLGAVRDGHFVSTDYDIDLGLLETETTLADVEALLDNSDFVLVQKNPWKLAYVSNLGIQIDFFLTRTQDGKFISRGEGEVHQWSFTPFELVSFEFLGNEFYIPQNPEIHLRIAYGNWEHQTLFYDPSFDEPCVNYGRNLNALMYLVHRFDVALTKRNRFQAEACLRALRDDFGVDRTHLVAQPGPPADIAH